MRHESESASGLSRKEKAQMAVAVVGIVSVAVLTVFNYYVIESINNNLDSISNNLGSLQELLATIEPLVNPLGE